MIQEIVNSHAWMDWPNFLAGVLGLLLTFGALLQAKGAKDAANGAKQAVLRRDASNSLAEVESQTRELVDRIQYERPAEAAAKAGDLSVRMSRISTQFGKFLNSDSKTKLEKLALAYRNLAIMLKTEGSLDKKDQMNAAYKIVMDANAELNAVLGSLFAAESGD